jgi:hypothetical protein
VGLFRRSTAPPAPAGPPLGVILHYRGLAIGCDVLREPDLDRRGQTAWSAWPAEPATLMPGEEPDLRATVLPDGCLLFYGPALQQAAYSGDEWWLPDTW